MSALAIEYHHGGLFLPRLGLWMDSPRAQAGKVFVSHAHSDHAARHREVLLSLPTAKLMRLRLGGRPQEHILHFGEPDDFHIGEVPFRLTLLPAGHVLGSAMALVEAEGERLLYTGDFKLRQGFAAEFCELRPADTLVMETTFGRPHYVFPPEQTVLAQIADFCRGAWTEGAIPVLLVYSLGKSQEVMRGLQHEEFEFVLHEQTYRISRTYEELGMHLPRYHRVGAKPATGKVVLWPPGALRSKTLQELGPLRRAVITGWALDPSCRYRYGVDAAFPLSDHADYPDLLRAVKRVSPSKIWTLHGYASDFADVLRRRGYAALALSEPDQLTLVLGDETDPHESFPDGPRRSPSSAGIRLANRNADSRS